MDPTISRTLDWASQGSEAVHEHFFEQRKITFDLLHVHVGMGQNPGNPGEPQVIAGIYG